MATEKTKKVDLRALITAITVNSKFTSDEATDLMHLLSAITQFALAEGVPVEIPGIGTLSVDDSKTVSFEASEQLKEILERKEIRIESKHGLTNTDLSMLGEWIYKHRVNVC